MGLMGPNDVVESLRATPLRGGLLTSIDASTDGRWEIGFSLLPEATAVTGDNLDAPCDPAQRTEPPSLWQIDYQPYEVSTSFVCEAPRFTMAELEDRARRQLAKVLSRNMERELWRGDVSQVNAWDNNWLANGSDGVYLDVSEGQTPLVTALGNLQQGLADQYNDAGVIHADIKTVTAWMSMQVVVPDGDVFRDLYGNLVITGPGYDGSDSNGDVPVDTSWAYATGPIAVRISPIDIVVEPASVVESVTTGRDPTPFSTNRVIVTASCFVAAYWDNMAHVACEVSRCNDCPTV